MGTLEGKGVGIRVKVYSRARAFLPPTPPLIHPPLLEVHVLPSGSSVPRVGALPQQSTNLPVVGPTKEISTAHEKDSRVTGTPGISERRGLLPGAKNKEIRGARAAVHLDALPP